jgi:hypothetical protein
LPPDFRRINVSQWSEALQDAAGASPRRGRAFLPLGPEIGLGLTRNAHSSLALEKLYFNLERC